MSPKPTIVPHGGFNSEKDAEALRGSMKGMGTNEQVLIDILCQRSTEQRKDIQKHFQQAFGRVLADDIKSETSGDFQKLLLSLFDLPAVHTARLVNKAVKGAGTDETGLIEVLCTRTNEEMEDAKKAYKFEFGKHLVEAVGSDTSGDFKKVLVALTAGARDEGDHVDKGKALEDAEALFNAGEKQAGTDEETFIRIFAVRSYAQLGACFEVYGANHGKDIEKIVYDEFSGCMRSALTAIAKCVLHGREAYFADQLHASMKGLGTNEDQLTRLVVGRAEIDLDTVKHHFHAKYEKTLEEFIAGETSGDYKKALLALCHGNH